MSYKVSAFGVQVEKPFLNTEKAPLNLSDCVKKDIESLLVMTTGIGKIQQKVDSNTLSSTASLKSLQDCDKEKIKLFSEMGTLLAGITHLDLSGRNGNSTSYTAAWILRKIANSQITSIKFKSAHSVMAVYKDGAHQLLNLVDQIGKENAQTASLAYSAYLNVKADANHLEKTVEESVRVAMDSISAHSIQLIKCESDFYDSVNHIRESLGYGARLNLAEIKTYPSADQFINLKKNYRDYVSTDSKINISNNGRRVVLTVTGDTIYQGVNLGRCNINESENDRIKKSLEEQFHTAWLSEQDSFSEEDVQNSCITFDELNLSYFTNTYSVIATDASIAIVPASPIGTTTSKLAQRIALEILESIKQSRQEVYEVVNRFGIVLGSRKDSVPDPRVLVRVANVLDPELKTVFGNYPMSTPDKQLLEDFLQDEFGLKSTSSQGQEASSYKSASFNMA